MVVVCCLGVGWLVDEVGISFQITDQGMALGERKGALGSLFADQAPDVLEPVGTAPERLVTGRVERGAGMLVDQAAQRHDRAQCLGTARINGCLCPLAAWIAQYRRPVDPVTARGENRGAKAAGPQGAAELAGFDADVHLHLLHPVIEDTDTTTVPAHPDLASDVLGRRFVISPRHFHVTVPMHAAARFLVTGKK